MVVGGVGHGNMLSQRGLSWEMVVVEEQEG